MSKRMTTMKWKDSSAKRQTSTMKVLLSLGRAEQEEMEPADLGLLSGT